MTTGRNRFYARSDPTGLDPEVPGSAWQLLAAHLTGTSNKARALAKAAAPGDLRFSDISGWAGLLHDLGKYTAAFQRRLRASARGEHAERVPHSGQGAAIAFDANAVDAAFAIAGHHAGLPMLTGGASSLRERLLSQADATQLFQTAIQDFSSEGFAMASGRPPPVTWKRGDLPSQLQHELSIRMLASVLVDADRLDAGGRVATIRTLGDVAPRLARLLRYVSMRAARVISNDVRDVRRQVLDLCLEAADWPERLLSLTVPTGGGKTLSAAAFALRRSLLRPEEARRLIYVVPYLSIIEQNAAVLAEALGADAILEHHSGEPLANTGEDEEGIPLGQGVARDSWLNRENWNAPVVVTTSVRFFETLFSNKPRDLRRLHAIARSVVVLDEVQTLPRGMVGPIITMLRELADHWATTFVFTTATPPAFERRSSGNGQRLPAGTIRHIVPRDLGLFRRLARVAASWPTPDGRLPVPAPWSAVAQALASEPRALCIVNLTRHARELFDQLRPLSAGCWHLSARMCATHRLSVLRSIRDALADGQPCRLIATQVVEAGVDLDFPVVFRAMAPLDSILQAAGRCDREGLLTHAAGKPAGRLVVFEPESGTTQDTPPGVYREATRITRRLVSMEVPDLYDPRLIDSYFEQLYGDGPQSLDSEDIHGHRCALDFPGVAERFRIIPDDSFAVVIEWGEEAPAAIREIIASRRIAPDHRRVLQRSSVSLHLREFEQLRRQGIVYEAFPESSLFLAAPGTYREDVGFVGRIDLPLIA